MSPESRLREEICRFARSLFERACACRDVRVVRLGESATAADLTTLTAADVRGAYTDLTV